MNTIPLYKQSMKELQKAVYKCYKIKNPVFNRCKDFKINSNYIGGEHTYIYRY